MLFIGDSCIGVIILVGLVCVYDMKLEFFVFILFCFFFFYEFDDDKVKCVSIFCNLI